MQDYHWFKEFYLRPSVSYVYSSLDFVVKYENKGTLLRCIPKGEDYEIRRGFPHPPVLHRKVKVDEKFKEKANKFEDWIKDIAAKGMDLEKFMNYSRKYPELMDTVINYDKSYLNDFLEDVFKGESADKEKLNYVMELKGIVDYTINYASSYKIPGKLKWGTLIDVFGKEKVAESANATAYEEFRGLFDEDDVNVLASLAKNPKAGSYKEFKNLLKSNKVEVINAIYNGPNRKYLLNKHKLRKALKKMKSVASKFKRRKGNGGDMTKAVDVFFE